MKRCLTCLLTALLLLFACTDDAEYVYSSYSAYFRYDQVLTTTPLYQALVTPGQYCMVWVSGQYLKFQSLTQSQDVLLTAVANYDTFESWAGFILGYSNVPDMTTGTLPIVAYDRVCPNCFEEDNISKALGLLENGFASCSRCDRVYDLNNLGVLYSGEEGIKLFRYKVAYNGSNLVYVNN